MGCCFRGHSFLLSPSYPHSLSPSRVPGVVLSAGARAECAAKRGHRHLLSFPKSVSAPDRRAGVGGQDRRLRSHTLAKGKCHPLILPKGCEVPGSYPRAGLSDLLWPHGQQGLGLVHHGGKALGAMEGVLCSNMCFLSWSWRRKVGSGQSGN